MFTGKQPRRLLAAVGVSITAFVMASCGSSSPSADLAESSSTTSSRPSIPSFSTYLACGALDYATSVETVMRNYIEGTAAQQDIAEPLRELGTSLSLMDPSLVEEVDGWSLAGVEAYQALGEDVKRFRVRVLDGPKLTKSEISAEVDSLVAAVRAGAPEACATMP